MKFLYIVLFLFVLLSISTLKATEVVGGLGYQSYNSDNTSFSTFSPSVEIYVPVYKNLSAGFAISYAHLDYGEKNDLASNVGFSGVDLENSASGASIPLQLALRYDYDIARDWRITGIIKGGLSSGNSNYYNATTCDGSSCTNLTSFDNRVTDDLEILAEKVISFDIGLIYKQYGFFVYYSAMNIVNNYNNVTTTFNSQGQITQSELTQNSSNNTMQSVGFKLSYLFDF